MSDRDVSLLAHDQYVRLVKWLSPLSAQEEEQLLSQVAQGKALGDVEMVIPARDRLVERYQGLVLHIAWRWWERRRPASMELLDLVQEGSLGLMVAIDDYCRDRPCAFRLLAGRCISHAIWRGLMERDAVVSLPESIHRLLTKARKETWSLRSELGREPSKAELAAKVDASVKQLDDAFAYEHKQYVASLEGLFEDSGDEEEFLDKHEVVNVFAACSDECDNSRSEFVRQAVETVLPLRQKEIVSLRFGLGEGGSLLRTCRTVAEITGCKLSAVENCEHKAKKKLAEVLADVIFAPSAQSYAAFPSLLEMCRPRRSRESSLLSHSEAMLLGA